MHPVLNVPHPHRHTHTPGCGAPSPQVTQLFGKIKRGMIKGDLVLALDPAMVRHTHTHTHTHTHSLSLFLLLSQLLFTFSAPSLHLLFTFSATYLHLLCTFSSHSLRLLFTFFSLTHTHTHTHTHTQTLSDCNTATLVTQVQCYDKLTWLPRIPKLEGRAVDPDIFI
jgi:hypothetical protein